MKRFCRTLMILAVLSLWITACEIKAVPAQTEGQPEQKSASYEVVLGKTMTDKAVIDFIVDNNCYPADPFQLCKEIGMAWWTGPDQVVRTQRDSWGSRIP